MGDDPRRLPEPPALPALPAAPSAGEPRVDVLLLPGNATLTWSRQDIVSVQHVSISPELAHARSKEAEARIAEASSRAEIARAEHAVPSEQ